MSSFSVQRTIGKFYRIEGKKRDKHAAVHSENFRQLISLAETKKNLTASNSLIALTLNFLIHWLVFALYHKWEYFVLFVESESTQMMQDAKCQN